MEISTCTEYSQFEQRKYTTIHYIVEPMRFLLIGGSSQSYHLDSDLTPNIWSVQSR